MEKSKQSEDSSPQNEARIVINCPPNLIIWQKRLLILIDGKTISKGLIFLINICLS